jgi:hypothetical protein
MRPERPSGSITRSRAHPRSRAKPAERVKDQVSTSRRTDDLGDCLCGFFVTEVESVWVCFVGGVGDVGVGVGCGGQAEGVGGEVAGGCGVVVAVVVVVESGFGVVVLAGEA